MASQLESLGVRNLAELEAMPPQARKELEAKMSSSGQSWDWNWLDGWKSKAGIGLAGVGLAGIGAASTRAGSTDSSDAVRSAVADLNLPIADGPSVDWNNLDGIDPRVAEQLPPTRHPQHRAT